MSDKIDELLDDYLLAAQAAEMNPATRQFNRAKAEGRVCSRCGWMVSIKNWMKGYRLCPGCWDASRGMAPIGQSGKYQDRDEPVDRTGEMI